MRMFHGISAGSLLLTLAVVGCSEPSAPVAEPAPQSADQATSAQETPAAEEEPFVPTMPVERDDFVPEAWFTALSVDDFTPFAGEEDTWQEIEGVIVCSGHPKGYMFSNVPYGNFTWRADYRFAPVTEEARRPLANTGFMVHIEPPHKVWPRSLEVQGRWDEMASIKANGGAMELVISDDESARQSARKPVGEWNAVEIVSSNGTLTATLNGERICTSEPGELTKGLIGLQSELFEVHFRHLRIRADE